MGVKWPAGFSQVSCHLRVTGHTTTYVVTLGILDTGMATPDVLAESVYRLFSPASTSAPFQASSMNTSYYFEKVAIARGPSTAASIGEYNEITHGSGGNSPPPPNCALLVKKNTGLGGRHGRGRIYVPPSCIGETQVSPAGVIDAGALSAVQADWSAVHASLTAAGHAPYLFHDDATIAPTLITGFSCQSLIATQRRRLR